MLANNNVEEWKIIKSYNIINDIESHALKISTYQMLGGWIMDDDDPERHYFQ